MKLTDKELQTLGTKLVEYCKKYKIKTKYIFEILEDQKVTPMIRGKASEYGILDLLKRVLNSSEWSIQKLNLNAQPNSPDEDISVTHRRTGKIIKVESKPGVRDSMKSGRTTRIHKVPHFKVKCHRSRSNKKLKTNDSYHEDHFDIIIINPANAVFKGKTIGPDLIMTDDKEMIKILYGHYNVSDMLSLEEAINNDWRCVIPRDIAEDNYIPRTPYVLLKDDPHWVSISEIETKLMEVISRKQITVSRR